MIVPMKKTHIIVQAKDLKGSLESLRDLGVVHLEHLKDLKSDGLAYVQEELNALNTVISFLQSYLSKKKVKLAKVKAMPECDQTIANILKDIKVIGELNELISKQKAEINRWQSWGDFSVEDIQFLTAQGLHLGLYEVPVLEKDKIPEGVILEVIGTAGKIERCLAISQHVLDLPFTKINFPEESLGQVQEKMKTAQEQLDDIEKEIFDCAVENLVTFKKIQAELREKLVFEEGFAGVGDYDDLSVLKGFCPEDTVEKLQKVAEKNKWALMVEDPTDEEMVPTLLRNPKWVKLIDPILKVVEIVPGYQEFDVSIVFLAFFTLFFGMLIGDAAYGLIFMGATFWAQKKFGPQMEDKSVFILMYLLTGFTVIWGVLTGTFFGQEWLPSSIKPLVPWLSDFENVQLLCFSIALVHLSIAKIWSAIRKFPSITFLADVGWVFIILGMFFVANMFVLGFALPKFAVPLFYVGIPLAFFFMVEPKKFLKVIGQELVPFILGVVGAGTDIVSYIRLFAVGLATVAVADATNSMAADLPLIAKILVLAIGHGLNLVLAAMAILVHAIRLNVLEFSGQLGMQWSGFQYKPFKKFEN